MIPSVPINCVSIDSGGLPTVQSMGAPMSGLNSFPMNCADINVGTPPIPSVSLPTLRRLELVTSNTSNGADGGNNWGTHKLRIVVLSNGNVFTTVERNDSTGLHKPYDLWKRDHVNGVWSIVYTGISGREPPNMLRGPQDQIYIVTWDGGLPSLTTSSDGVNFSGPTLVPGSWYGPNDYPYSCAAINPQGDIYVVMSNPDDMAPGEVRVGYKLASEGTWRFQIFATDYRYCYYFVFVGSNGQIQMEGLRNPLWTSVPGYFQPTETTFQYMFDGLRQYRSADLRTGVVTSTYITEETQTVAYDWPSCFAHDIIVDNSGNMIIYYCRNGASNLGVHAAWVAILDSSGTITYNAVQTGQTSERSNRYLQSPTSNLIYMIDSNGIVYNAGADGKTWGGTTTLNFSSYPINGGDYSIFLATPRGGMSASVYADGVYASGMNWVYFRIQLP